jgi:hypothetical protein
LGASLDVALSENATIRAPFDGLASERQEHYAAGIGLDIRL